MPQRIAHARELLLSCGKRHLAGGRAGSFSIHALTEECGMSVGTFYQYFRSKDELLMQVLAQDWSVRVDATAAPDELSLQERLRRLYGGLRQFEQDDWPAAAGLFRSTEDYLLFRSRNVRQLCAAMEGVLRRGGTRPPESGAETAAFVLTEVLLSAARDSQLTFDELWRCLCGLGAAVIG